MAGAISTTAFIFALSGLVTGITSILLAAFVLWKNPKNSINRSWAFFCVTVSLWGFSGFHLGMSDNSKDALFWMMMAQVGIPLIAPAFFHFSMCFIGRGTLRSKAVVWNYLFGAFFVTVNIFLTPLFLQERGLILSSLYWPKSGPLYLPMFIWWTILVYYTHVQLYRTARQLQGNRRNQLHLFYWGTVIGYVGGSPGHLITLGFDIYPYGNWAIPIYSILATYAIIKYKAMEIQTVIHKSIAWFTLSCVIALPVALLFYFGHAWLSSRTPFEFSIIMAGFVLLLIPYSHFVQPRIDHLFQRRKYDMQAILQGLVKELAGLKDLDSLLDKIVQTIKEALYVTKVSLLVRDEKSRVFRIKGEGKGSGDVYQDPFLQWVKDQDCIIELEEVEQDPKYESIRPAAQSYFRHFDAKIVIPLIHDEKLIGVLNLGEKANLKHFSKIDLDFLSQLRAEASISLSNSLLYDDVSKLSGELRQWANELEHKVEERTHELAESKHQLEESYQKLRELDAFKSQFFANISHEFRTPLTLMLAPIDVIRKQKVSDRVQIHRQLDIAYNNGLRLLKLINNLLDLAKIDAGKMELQYRQVNLSTFLRGMMAEMSQVAEQRGLTLHLSILDLSLTVFLDPEKIEKVLLNLLFNAIKFTPSGGKITVACQLEGEQVCISVRDTGVGIPLEIQSKIFDRFFQVHGATTRPHEGTGIGLAVAKELVELHGGTLSVKSAADGGTIFSFTLPWKKEMESFELGPEWIPAEGFGQLSREANYNTADLAPHPLGPKPSISNTGSRPKILVIEDNADMRYFLSEKLSEHYDVLAAADGEEGIQIAKESLPDLILSDVMMPKKNGYEVCRELKNDPETASLPILLLTAKADLPSKLEGFQSRADDYLIKPFNADELLARVRTQIERRNSVKSLEEYLKQAHHRVKEANLLMMEMAHEIKNPISYAKGNISLLSRSVKESQQSGEWERTFEEMQNSIQIIEAGLNRVSIIVKNVKEFVSPNLNARADLSLREMIESTLRMLSYQIDGKITLHRNYETAATIKGVPEQLHQVFTNLIKNAIEAMNGVGQLWIQISQEGKETIVSIRDDGPGIPGDHLPHLFEPFYTTKREKGGTGLGLAICKKIIEAHHGRIEVRSQEQAGTEFLIFLTE